MTSITRELRRQLAATEYEWATKIVTKHFDDGIRRTFERSYVERRPHEFKTDRDPIYSRLLESTGPDVYATFVGFWKLGQHAVPAAPPGWTPYIYTPAADGTFTVESSGDGTTARVP